MLLILILPVLFEKKENKFKQCKKKYKFFFRICNMSRPEKNT